MQARRVNCETLGDSDAYPHAHVWARNDREPAGYIGGPVWRYPRDVRNPAEHAFHEGRHGEIQQRIRAALEGMVVQYGFAS
jgi:hypothetical protein